ncbi:MAG TPA: patatin-like phospholipase family protein [Candidatus Methylomirabilis sp.]|nr:patatin-like phospholipase family protein [Candidatus Methylomirabilis sp.]
MKLAPGMMRILALAFALLAAGCASFPKTEHLAAYDESKGYRYERLDKTGNQDDLFIILTFSGGGTRAAALSYGVLEALRDSTVEIDGKPRNLLDEVDVISSVSGGSFTAAYYALHGNEIFEEGGRFQKDFLYHDVEADLFYKLLNPYNWARLASPEFGRIDLASELYQELLFGDATFHDLEARGRKPFVMLNATDMVKGAQFTFTQSQFDPLCADLGRFSIARAVAASSDFPLAFSPLAVNSYPGTCGYVEPGWVAPALRDLSANPRRYYRARMLRTYEERDRHFVHLLDGGVADNIGLRGPLTSIRSGDVDWSVLNKVNNEEIRKLVVIVVDARNEAKPEFDESPRAPGTFTVVNAIATTPLDNYSFDSIELLQDTFRRRDDAQRRQPDLHQVQLYRIYVGFDQITNDAEREAFLSIKTAFVLPRAQVDALRRQGAELLLQSECFQKLVHPPAGDKARGCP